MQKAVSSCFLILVDDFEVVSKYCLPDPIHNVLSISSFLNHSQYYDGCLNLVASASNVDGGLDTQNELPLTLPEFLFDEPFYQPPSTYIYAFHLVRSYVFQADSFLPSPLYIFPVAH